MVSSLPFVQSFDANLAHCPLLLASKASVWVQCLRVVARVEIVKAEKVSVDLIANSTQSYYRSQTSRWEAVEVLSAPTLSVAVVEYSP